MEISPIPPIQTVDREKLEAVAMEMEASFLAQMLKSADFGKSRGEMGGGAGEDVFSGMLVQQQAKILAQHGGIGLAQGIVDSLMRRNGNA